MSQSPRPSSPPRPARPTPAQRVDVPSDATINLAGMWTISDGLETYTLVFVPSRENTYHGRYTDVPDPSVFVAQVLTTARGAVLNMVQTLPERQYVATYGAHRLPGGAFAGSWTDVDGNSAEFELTPM